MAITLGTLRVFCQEVASKDAQGNTAEREFMDWINGALEKLYLIQSLDATRREMKLYVPPSVTRTDGVVTQGSLVVTSATGFLDVWRSERWGIHIEDETDIEFEIASLNIGLTDATMRTGENWVQASGTAKDVVATKNKFNIPTVLEILDVRHRTGITIPFVPPDEFDRLKQHGPTYRSDHPQVCTYRNDYLEIWPSPDEGYWHMQVTYRLAFSPHPRLAVADGGDADATTVAWPDRYLSLLKKAIVVEASAVLGKNAPVPYATAVVEFNQTLSGLLATSQKEMKPGPIRIQTPLKPRTQGRYSLPPRNGIEWQ